MKYIKILSLVLMMVTSLNTNAQKDAKPMKSELDTISHAIGLSIGKNLVGSGIDSISLEQLVEGLKLAYTQQVTQEQLKAATDMIDSYVQEIQAKKAAGVQ